MENLKIELKKEEVETLLHSLEKMPFNMVNVLIQNIIGQCNEQLQPKEDIPGFEGTMEALDEL
jgi:hypothetical protein